jgi:CheY-like chemotaxis protein
MAFARILYVEDDDDIRDTMTMLLQHEGYHVTALASVELALDELARRRYDLLLTDYRFRTRNASWLIDTAAARGCLGDTPVIVLSADDRPDGIAGHRLLRKPVSLETLLAAFDQVLPTRGGPPVAVAGGAAELRLTLYAAPESQASRRAMRNLERVLEGVDPAAVELVVHEVTPADPSWVKAAEEDRVVVLPTLVRGTPRPKVWIAGDLSEVEVVRDAILPVSMLARGAARR